MPKHVSSHAKKRLMERVGIKSDYGTLLNEDIKIREFIFKF